MRKISALTDTADSAGEFTDGSVASGKSPTILPSGWFNTIQRELVALVEGAGLSLDSADDTQVLAAIQSMLAAQNSGRLIQIVRIDSSRVYTPSPLAKKLIVKLVGAGGSGGSGITVNANSGSSSGGGGGGGGYIEFEIDIAAAGFKNATITIGKGGASVTGGAGVGGGSTYFGSDLFAFGGNAGTVATRAIDSTYNYNCYMVIPGEGGAYYFPTKTGYTLLHFKRGLSGGWGMLGGSGQLGGAGGSSHFSGSVGRQGNMAAGFSVNSFEYGGGGGGSCTYYDAGTPSSIAYTAKASGAGANGYVEIYELT